jgi:hypothetical protein
MPNLYTNSFINQTAKKCFHIGIVVTGKFLKNDFGDPLSSVKRRNRLGLRSNTPYQLTD